MSDVNNPLTGALGATAIFGPQKGVRAGRRRARSTRRSAASRALAERRSAARAAENPAPARPAAWASRCSCWAARSRSGAEVVADSIGLDAALADADWVITGEGRSDRQTLLAKAPFVVARARGTRRRSGHAGLRRHRSGGARRTRRAFRGLFRAAARTRDARGLHRQRGATAGRAGRADRPPLPGRARRAAAHCEIIAPAESRRANARATARHRG